MVPLTWLCNKAIECMSTADKDIAQAAKEAYRAGLSTRKPLQVTTGARVALRNDSYTLHLLLPTKVDPLVSLMKVEKVPDSTYDMIGGLDQQIKEIKEVRRPLLQGPNLFGPMGLSEPSMGLSFFLSSVFLFEL